MYLLFLITIIRPVDAEVPAASVVVCTQAGDHCTCVDDGVEPKCFARFSARIQPIPDSVWSEMAGVSFKDGCPVGRDALRLIGMPHWDEKMSLQPGELVVAAAHAADVVAIFEDIYNARFSIARMERVDRYGGSDSASMRANNTSAFNCRPVSGTSTWSQHSYGTAIDINPLWNPWVKGSRVDPKSGAPYADRSHVRPGMIVAGDSVVTAFKSRGWGWGGAWSRLKDYQHFSENGR